MLYNCTVPQCRHHAIPRSPTPVIAQINDPIATPYPLTLDHTSDVRLLFSIELKVWNAADKQEILNTMLPRDEKAPDTSDMPQRKIDR